MGVSGCLRADVSQTKNTQGRKSDKKDAKDHLPQVSTAHVLFFSSFLDKDIHEKAIVCFPFTVYTSLLV